MSAGFFSHFGHSAVDRKLDAAYEASLRRSEKSHHRRDFVRPAHSPYGDLSHHGGGDLRRIWMFITQVVVERGVDGAGADGIDSYAPCFQLHRPSACKSAQRRLGGAVGTG